MRFDPLGPIEDEIRRELDRFGPVAGLGEVVSAWPEVVGEAIAANAWPARLARDGSLHVTTSSSAWAFELTQLSGSVLARLQERLGEVAPQGLRFAPGPLPERGTPPVESPKRTAPRVSKRSQEEAEKVAASIENPDLREVVAKAAAASLAAAESQPDDRPV
ncbi:MAG: DUF721 domain-containing protein [Gaiellaceae bacterium]